MSVSKNSTDLIFVHIDSKTPYVLTKDLWSGFGYKEHRTLKRVIETHEIEFIDRGLLASIDAESTGGRPEKSYQLNERQFRLLCFLVKNTPTSVKIKSAIENEFDRLKTENEQLLRQQSNKNWLEAREAAKTSFKFMNAMLTETRKEQGKETKDYHYMTEAKLVNFALKGEFKGLKRGRLTDDDLVLLFDLQALNSRLIARDISYQDRKDSLIDFVDKIRPKNQNLIEEPKGQYTAILRCPPTNYPTHETNTPT